MSDRKYSVLGTMVSALTYDDVVTAIIDAAEHGRTMTVAAVAVHAVMTAVQDRQFRCRLNQFDVVAPDGQPVRWALRLLHHVRLPDRVYGPSLTLHLCQAAERAGMRVYFYGSSPETLKRLRASLGAQFPNLHIVGMEPSVFRQLTEQEQEQMFERIRAAGAQIVFVGLGCPRQEIWAFEARTQLDMPIAAVGAAFDFLSGSKPQAPEWMQSRGLEWLFRLVHEPRRLWRRYLLLNPAYLFLLAVQFLKLRQFNELGDMVVTPQRYG
jgi:exopolysaccharide biosynthesis WecB/TagA/CpsF family protein